jgi:hypothetical protein
MKKQSICLLSIERQEIFTLITQQNLDKNDFLANAFISGTIPHAVTLHYFEHSHNIRREFDKRTYNAFLMNPDFWDLVTNYKGIIPTSRAELLKYFNNEKTKKGVQ